jgi:hypothetical protein
VQEQQTPQGSSPTVSTPSPTLTSPAPLPSVQDVTDALPVTVPETSVPAVELPPVDVTPQLPELPKLP